MSLEVVNKAWRFMTGTKDYIYIGDPSDEEFHPKLLLERWNAECKLQLGFDDSGIVKKDKSCRLEENKVKWSTPDFELHFYPLAASEQCELGGLELEIILKKKPATNTFIFPIQTEGLNFYYQPPLTEQEIAKGCIRPDNVVGSYAVYHATRTNMHRNKEDAEKYKTGKAFHIHRPLAKDSAKNQAWCDLNIDETKGLLTIAIPQEFLDKAVYPISIDPTFGYTTIGGTYGWITGGSTNYIAGSLFTCPENGIADSITTALCRDVGSSDTNAKCALYKHSDLSLKGGTQEVLTSLTTTFTWFTYNYAEPKPNIINEDYIIAAWTADVESGRYVRIAYDTGSANQDHEKQYDYTTNFPNPLPSPTHGTPKYSIYCTYTTGGVTHEIYTDAISQSLATPAEECIFNITKDASVASQALHAPELTFNISQDAVTQALASVVVEIVTGIIEIFKDAIVQASATGSYEISFIIPLDAIAKTTSSPALESIFNLSPEAVVRVLAEVSVLKEGEVKVTKLFLMLGNLAVQIQGD